MRIVAVTVLTSLDEKDLQAIGCGTDITAQVETLARMAWREGVRDFVCSPHEASRLRTLLGPKATLITPGVRAPSDPPGDQKRTMTASEAIHAGASWVVIGRPIRDAADPRAAAYELARAVNAARGAG